MSAIDLVTLADVKAYIGSSGIDDQLLTRLVTASSQYIQSWLNRTFASAAYTETRDGNGGQRMLFANYPVTAVSSLTIDGIAIPLSTSPLIPGYVFSSTGIMLRSYTFTQGFQNVVIGYTAGYATVPEDIRQACIDMVALKYRQRDRIGINSKTLAGEAVTFNTDDMPANVKTILGNYKKVVPL